MADNLGERIKLVRKKAGITQGELARRLGIAYPTLNKYERGHRKPDSSILQKIVHALECDPGWLLTGEGYGNESGPPQITRTPVFCKAPEDFPKQVSEEACDYISLPDVPAEACAFIVNDDSMSPAIYSGDYAIFVHGETITGSDVIVVNDEWGKSILRRYHIKDRKTFLVSENPEYPILSIENNYKIIGKVITVWRKIKI